MTANEITEAKAFAMHGQPVRIEIKGGQTIFGEIEVADEGRWSSVRVRAIPPFGGERLPGDQLYHRGLSPVQRVTQASRAQLLDFLAQGRDVAARWKLGANTWLLLYNDPLPPCIYRQVYRQEIIVRATVVFKVKTIVPHTRWSEYRLLDGTTIQHPVRGFAYQLEDGTWIDDACNPVLCFSQQQ